MLNYKKIKTLKRKSKQFMTETSNKIRYFTSLSLHTTSLSMIIKNSVEKQQPIDEKTRQNDLKNVNSGRSHLLKLFRTRPDRRTTI